MQQKLKLIAVLVSAICVTACGSGDSKSLGVASVGVSSESSTTNSTPIGLEVAQLEKLSNSKETKNFSLMPAQVALAPALLGDYDGANGPMLRAIFARLKYGPQQWAKFNPAEACNEVTELAKKKDAEENTKRVSALCKTNHDEALKEIKHVKAVNAVNIASSISFSPTSGWEVDPFKRNTPEMNVYLNNFEVGACITNNVGVILADAIGKVVMPDPQAIKARADRLFKAIGDDQILSVVDSCIAKYPLENNNRIIDMTGTKGVQFSTGAEQFEIGGAGLILTSYGVEMFGKGSFNGKKYDIASSIGTGLSIDTSSGVSSGTSTETANSAKSKTDIKTGN